VACFSPEHAGAPRARWRGGQISAGQFPFPEKLLISSVTRGSAFRLSVPGCPPGSTIMSKSSTFTVSMVVSGMIFTFRALVICPFVQTRDHGINFQPDGANRLMATASTSRNRPQE